MPQRSYGDVTLLREALFLSHARMWPVCFLQRLLHSLSSGLHNIILFPQDLPATGRESLGTLSVPDAANLNLIAQGWDPLDSSTAPGIRFVSLVQSVTTCSGAQKAAGEIVRSSDGAHGDWYAAETRALGADQ